MNIVSADGANRYNLPIGLDSNFDAFLLVPEIDTLFTISTSKSIVKRAVDIIARDKKIGCILVRVIPTGNNDLSVALDSNARGIGSISKFGAYQAIATPESFVEAARLAERIDCRCHQQEK